MADLTESGDISKVRYIVPTRKIVRKRSRLNIRDRNGQQPQNKNKSPSGDKKKNHIDVYA